MNKPEREGFVEIEPVEDDDVVETKKVEPPPVEDSVDIDADLPEWPLTIKLMHKPIMKGREELNELTFREPTAMDIIRCGGNPCRIEIIDLPNGQTAFYPVIDDGKMMRVMANLAGLLEPQLQKMDPRDYNSCAHRLRRFFLPEQGVW
jgi:hypothetical protein